MCRAAGYERPWMARGKKRPHQARRTVGSNGAKIRGALSAVKEARWPRVGHGPPRPTSRSAPPWSLCLVERTSRRRTCRTWWRGRSRPASQGAWPSSLGQRVHAAGPDQCACSCPSVPPSASALALRCFRVLACVTSSHGHQRGETCALIILREPR